MPLGIDVAGTESRLIWHVMRVVVRMSLGLSAGAIAPRGSIQRFVDLPRVKIVMRISRANLGGVKSGGRHDLDRIIEDGLLEDVAALLGIGFLQERIGSDLGPIALVTRQHVVLALN